MSGFVVVATALRLRGLTTLRIILTQSTCQSFSDEHQEKRCFLISNSAAFLSVSLSLFWVHFFPFY
jgi:hypothetical protein